MTDLADFLLARIAEDEAVASPEHRAQNMTRAKMESIRVANPELPPWPNEPFDSMIWRAYPDRHPDDDAVEGDDLGWQSHCLIANERMLAECEAKRRIIEVVTRSLSYDRDDYEVLQLLALPYANHEQFKEEWRPSDV